MGRFEIEIDEASGELQGDIPQALKSIFDRIDVTAHGRGYQKAVGEAKPQIEDGIKAGVAAEVARINAQLPLEREKWERIESESKTLRQQIIDQAREHDRTLKSREEHHAREVLQRGEALQKRNARIAALVKTTLRGEATRAGARDESLEELEEFLFSRIGFDDDMEPFVKQGDGSPKLVQGKPQPIATFVKEYIDTHPHHRRPAGGAGGGARGGAYRAGIAAAAGSSADFEAAQTRFLDGDQSNAAIEDMFAGLRKKRTSAA